MLIVGAGINFLTIRIYSLSGVIAVCLSLVLVLLLYAICKDIQHDVAKVEDFNTAARPWFRAIAYGVVYFIAFLIVPGAIALGCCGSILFFTGSIQLYEKLALFIRNRKKVSGI